MSTNASSCDSLACNLGEALRSILGLSLVLVGSVMILTFFLMPLGLPLALLGAALLGSGGEPAAPARGFVPAPRRTAASHVSSTKAPQRWKTDRPKTRERGPSHHRAVEQHRSRKEKRHVSH